MEKVECTSCKKKFLLSLVSPYHKSKYTKKNGEVISHVYYMCRKCNTKRSVVYRNTINGRTSFREASSRFRIKNKKVACVWSKVHWALSMGKIIKPKICGTCKKRKNLDAHHKDYNKPLSVMWLCRACHADEHRKML